MTVKSKYYASHSIVTPSDRVLKVFQNKPIDTQIVLNNYYARFSSCNYDKVMTIQHKNDITVAIMSDLTHRGHISGGIRAGGVTPKTIRKTKKAFSPNGLKAVDTKL